LVDERRARRQLLARDDTDDAVLGIQPDHRDVALARARADHGDPPVAHAYDVTHVVAHAERPPLGQHVGRGPPRGDEQAGALAAAAGRGRLVDLPVCPPDPDTVADGELDFTLAFDVLLDTLALGQLEEHALLARRMGVTQIGRAHV